MTSDHEHRDVLATDTHPKQQPPILARALAQRLAVERASTRFQALSRWYDETEAWRNTSMAADEELSGASDQLALLLAAAGWPGVGSDATRLDLLRQTRSWHLRRVLRLDAGADLSHRHRVGPGDVYEATDQAASLSVHPQLASELRPTYMPVTVLIGEGTTEEEAVALLQQVLERLRDEFDGLLLSPEQDLGSSETPSEEEGLPEWDQILLVSEGSYRSARWEGGPILGCQEARALAQWLCEQAALGEGSPSDPSEDGDAFPL